MAGNGRRATPKYGCPSHRYRGTCGNGLLIRQDRLEKQLLAGLEKQILTQEAFEYTVRRLEECLEIYRRTVRRNNNGDNPAVLNPLHERAELQAQVTRIVDAIAAAGHSEALVDRLSEIEARIANLGLRIRAAKAPRVNFSKAQIRASPWATTP